jgi:transposase InsO family protein
MPWTGCRVQRRDDFVHEWFERKYTMTELCERYQISRKTGYKWLNRVRKDGAGDLSDRSSRPRSNSRAWSEQSVDWFLQLRKRHPTAGPKKLYAMTVAKHPMAKLPAVSTIGDWLRKNGLNRLPKRRRKPTPSEKPFRECTQPNAVWCADFKGHFPVDRKRCYPLTIMDQDSRFLLACEALKSPSLDLTKKMFERVFQTYGLPDAIRTDNGEPFASTALAGLSQLSVWFIKLGIRPERIEPGKPQQNGRHERMHRTLKQETATPPQANFLRQQRAFDEFRHWYNTERPHEALGQTPPADRYSPSDRPYDSILTDPEYPPDYETRRAQKSGVIQWRGERVFLTSCLGNELIGLREVTLDVWEVHFGQAILGFLDEKRKPWRVRTPKLENPNS